MKKQPKFIFLLVALTSLFFACSSDDDTTTEPEKPAEVALESFGFYKEDNTQLLEDYVVENIEGDEVKIALPAEVDKTSLIARFTTSANDKVTVGGVEQVSGVTANNFSAPLEYILNEGNKNVIYTIKVTDKAYAVWSILPAFDMEVTDISMSVNPTNSNPAIAYVSNPESSSDRKLNLISFDGNQWGHIGAENFTPARARNVNLAYKKDGTPLVSFRDDNLDPSQISVMGYQSNTWDYVGIPGISGIKASHGVISTDTEGNIYDFYIHDDNNDKANKRSILAKTYKGAAWAELPITGRTGAAIVIKTKEANGNIYLLALNFGDLQSISVYKYDGNNWTTLADQMKDSPENTILYREASFAIDAQGNVYVAYAENNGEGTEAQLKVKKYAAETQSWSTLGSNIVTTSLRSFDIAVDAYANPMVLYKNDTENPVVVSFDNKTYNWGETTVLSNLEADDLQITVAPNGVGYASYKVENQLYVHKYDSPDNN